MRADEEMGRKALDSLLREYGEDREWTKGTEPPDYYLNFKGRRLAVEITSIHGFTDLNGRKYPWIELEKHLLPFGDDICAKIESKVRVDGCFFITFPSIPSLEKRKAEILRGLTGYFQTEACETDRISSQAVLRIEGREVSVMKISEEGSGLIAGTLPTGAFITHREDQLQELLTGAIETKSKKLRKIEEPAILVILDYYGFQRGIDEWRERLSNEAPNFEAIVRVQGGEAELVSGRLVES